MRTPTACRQCRRSKRRCIPHEDNQTCAPCHQRHMTCETKRRAHLEAPRILVPRISVPLNASTQVVERGTDSKPLLSQGTTIELVEHYLDKIEGRPHSLFHPDTLRYQVRCGALSKVLLCAICAIGCKFSVNPDTRGQGMALIEDSKRLLQADLLNICLENIQACILVATLSVGHGDSVSEALFFRIATTMAEIMHLNDPPLGGSAVDRETRHRVWWSLYMTDMWCISGQGLHSQLKDMKTNIEVPMDDSIFMKLKPDQTSIVGAVEHGIWSNMTTLVPLFEPIHNLNRGIARGEVYNIDLDEKVEELARSLEDWKEKLPDDAQMNQDNLGRQQKNGLGGLLISIHLAFHYFSILLYFRYLEAQQPASSIRSVYVIRCKFHASTFSSLLQQSRQLKGCDVLYPKIGHMTTVSSSVLVHTLLNGDMNELETVSRELNANFEALTEFTQYWPVASAMIERLVVFQDMCLLSTEPGTHRLDGWMLRFLIEHSLDIEVKKLDFDTLNQKGSSEIISSKARELAEQGRYLNF